MFNNIKSLAIAAVAVGAMVLSSASHATCVTAGSVATIWSYNTTYGYVGISPESAYGTDYVVYYYVPTSYSAWSVLNSAAASDEYVYVQGDASTCPTTGTIRYGGTATYAFHTDQY